MKKGDVVRAVAQPFARGIDTILGTNIAECSGCKQMRNNLNSGMSFAEALLQRFRRKETMEFIVNRSIKVIADSPETALELTKPPQGISMAFNVNPLPQQMKPPVAPPQK